MKRVNVWVKLKNHVVKSSVHGKMVLLWDGEGG